MSRAAEPSPRTPLDLVYTWVDGARFSHLVKRTYHGFRESRAPDNTWERWADRDELRYALRSVARNAPFFDRIFIVTADGRGPPWLQTSDKIQIVSHSEIMPREYLPTFSSCSIESFLHRIPGLSERFVYSNDDLIFWSPVDESFFVEGEKAKILLYDELVPDSPVSPKDSGHIAGKKNADRLLDRRFGPARRREVGHTPVSVTKSSFQAVWDAFPSEAREAAACRFRSSRSLAFTNHLLPHFMLLEGTAVGVPADGLDVGVGFHSSRLKNLAATYLKYEGRLPEQRARELLSTKPDCRVVWISCDRTTTAKILGERFSEPGPYEKA